MAKNLIESKGHRYTEKVVGLDLTKDEFFSILGPEVRKTVPQIFRGDRRIGGYEDLLAYYEEVTNNYGKQGF
jgi:glutaredoxin